MVGGNADQHLLCAGILPPYIVRIVGRRKGDARFLGQAHQQRIDFQLFAQTVILYFQIIVSFAENVPIPQGNRFRFFVVPSLQCLGHFAEHTARKGDQSLVMLPKQFQINAGLNIKARCPTLRNHGDQVLVAHIVLTQQNQMEPFAVGSVKFVVSGAGRHITLTADDRLDSPFLRSLIKINHAVHDAVIGNCHGSLPQFLGTIQYRTDAAGAVQQTVLGMQM